MSVRIQFDQPDNYCYTNLDYVSGRATLILPQDATISAITVKLEAESRTRLSGPKHPYNERSEKKRTELEVHKLLYKVLTVFPTPELQASAPSQYTLLAGQYVYPFRFKFPFNNDCSASSSMLKDLKVGQLNVQFAPDVNQHVKKTLPPSLSGFPGEAEIKYYVKATVVRPKFYQENFRTETPIKFLPIEAPRPTDKQEETFARRKQQFQKYPAQSQQRKGSLFKKPSESEKPEQEPPTFQVDARLPNPAILTCNEPLPLRVLVQKLGDTEADVYLSMFQIELIGYTHVRAHDLNRTESGSWVIKSLANMNMPLNVPNRKSQTEFKVPSHLWENIPIPNTVAPSFETCNISRNYELEIRVGLSHAMGGSARPELIVLPLRIPVEVWSGIPPPPELLRAMQERAENDGKQSTAFPEHAVPSKAASMASDTSTPTTPMYDHSQAPAPVGTSRPPNSEEFPDHAPPSYEDAMAEDFTPVDGPRRNYSVPEGDQQSPAFNSDTKGGGLGRRVSERLFSSNAPAGPRRAVASESNPIQEEQQTYTEENPPPLPQRTSTTEKS